jgi:hypothetical protein
VYVINGKGSVIRLVAGTVVTAGSLLALLESRWWLLVTTVVGINLVISATTGFCLMEKVLEALGMEVRTPAAVLRRITVRR